MRTLRAPRVYSERKIPLAHMKYSYKALSFGLSSFSVALESVADLRTILDGLATKDWTALLIQVVDLFVSYAACANPVPSRLASLNDACLDKNYNYHTLLLQLLPNAFFLIIDHEKGGGPGTIKLACFCLWFRTLLRNAFRIYTNNYCV